MASEKIIVLHGDPEHEALRLTIPIVFLVGVVISFGLLITFLPRLLGGGWTQFVILSGCLAVPLGMVVMKVADVIFKRRWHSGQEIQITAEGITFQRPDGTTTDIPRPVTRPVLAWGFKMEPFARIGRERQIPDGWYCAAVQLQHEGARVVVHSYLPPKEAPSIFDRLPFIQLSMGEIYDMSLGQRLRHRWSPSGRPDLPNQLIIGENGRYWLAEKQRWESGVELTPQDFNTLLNALAPL